MNRKEKQKIKKFNRKLKSLHPKFRKKAAFTDEVVVYFDGGCNPNPGAGYGSYQVKINGTTRPVQRLSFGGNCTNNVAELLTVLNAIKSLDKDYTVSLLVVGDSKLALNTISGEWNAKHENIIQIVAEAKFQLGHVATFDTLWVPRKEMVSRFGH